jgi:transcriptional regulator with XRE-family HTH domain
MENIKQIVAKNIADLRRGSGLTQLEFAEKLNYSDKAVSKWERGDSLPDVAVLKQIADLFQVTLDYLVTEDHTAVVSERTHYQGRELRNRKIITGISILLVWLAATIAFVVVDIVLGSSARNWVTFLYGVPVSMIICLIFNSLWFNPRWNFLFVSVLMWSVLVGIHISLLLIGFNIWIIYILGIPGQAIILLWSGLKLKKRS